ncbi:MULTISPECIES: HAD-IIB family hydrolase [unclassified Streptomyces]|uniref:HAD-IIB family hydrolase n=1 Tax=unclassified Streptomyces TaxID=2593676 RepID=UPI002E135F23|nr:MULTISPECIES: HAD-IIB family hydrolase [unclassified Streptomyces]WSQ79725.1 HAD-IIB family hydrolase [Streptomyces sp. NBC_01213]WSQ87105.1 HAD-IIB family hydrolase [Streptomyces sp. NBC_01212]WSR06879.1 HAD-IIB family hydrolase [Streptomyces sp. NBC_01208]WSR50382.1 HAD-IIB family hydrolase [Streptomyces sp. NBC_01201]
MLPSVRPRAEPASLPVPRRVGAVAFCDFDETYLAHAPTAAEVADREALEDFLVEAAGRHGLLFGWVTGSSLPSVMDKVRAHRLRRLPHFIACSLGTELLYLRDGVAHPDPSWQERLPEPGRLASLAEAVTGELADRGVPLVPQEGRPPGSLVRSHYYYARTPASDERSLALVRSTAERYSLGVGVSRCNPAAGDPENCYDVDFLPAGCGKRAVVRHVRRAYGVPPADTFAFGDSGNDLEMLREAGRGVLVANCTAEARSRHPDVSGLPYAAAILAVLRDELRDRPREEPRKESR